MGCGGVGAVRLLKQAEEAWRGEGMIPEVQDFEGCYEVIPFNLVRFADCGFHKS